MDTSKSADNEHNLCVSAPLELDDGKIRIDHEDPDTLMTTMLCANGLGNQVLRRGRVRVLSPSNNSHRLVRPQRTANWRAVCGRSACTVRREGGRRKAPPYPYRAQEPTGDTADVRPEPGSNPLPRLKGRAWPNASATSAATNLIHELVELFPR